MANVNHAIQAKSDQLNFDDFAGHKRIITITDVRVTTGEQPVSIFYNGHNGKPWKPSKGMIRLICEAWGEESDSWIGKSIELYGDATVKWAGQEIGGIRISALSDINQAGLTAFVTISRGKRRKQTIPFLAVSHQTEITEYDLEWINAAKADIAVLDQITDAAYKARIKSLI